MNFWDELFKKNDGVIGLSPMDGVTDAPMRYMVGKYGKPDVLFTEFVSVDALAHVSNKHKAEMVLRALIRARDVDTLMGSDLVSLENMVGLQDLTPESARDAAWPMGSDLAGQTVNGDPQDLTPFPYEVAQVFGHTPELFYKAAVLVATLGFDGMDINMGCPAHKVEELGSGAGLIRTPDIALEIVRQAKLGIADYAAGKVGIEDLGYSDSVCQRVSRSVSQMISNPADRIERQMIPVSVKTRIGVERDQVEEWIPTIMKAQPAVLSLHGRTLKQLYQGRADWEAIGRAAEIVHGMGGKILGNGDVKSLTEAKDKCKQYGVDGVLIGRAAEGNPGVFAGIDTPSREGRLAWLLEHARVYNKLFVENETPDYQERAFMPLRKHLAWYAAGFPGASEMRQKLVMCKSLGEVEEVVAT